MEFFFQITWYHDNQILRKNERLNFLDEDRYYCLDVGWTVLPDEGHWTCIAENKHGCSVSSAYLTILGMFTIHGPCSKYLRRSLVDVTL